MTDIACMREAILIRRAEQKLLELFSFGKLNGTVHTCVGQEFSPVAFMRHIDADDYVVSNHRCHGHYIAYTKECKSLIGELMGKKTGACGGIGGSQHLCNRKFFSNGIQGGMVPIAAGFAMALKLNAAKNVVMAFIGDGTLGEGVLYETMNIAAKWRLPLLIVCENNYYAQSTKLADHLAGDILERARSFGLRTFQSDIWHLEQLFDNAKASVDYVRDASMPAFHLVDLYRLNPHSKGDDYRDASEVERYAAIDPIHVFRQEHPRVYRELVDDIDRHLDETIREAEAGGELSLSEYFSGEEEREARSDWTELSATGERQADRIHSFFEKEMKRNEKLLFIGEDVSFPYGGAFKVAKDLSEKYPGRVFSTPISEAAVTGISSGLAMAGYRPVLEIMFGDFITLCMDQIVNHASKFGYMFNGQTACPIVIRTPMGGGRGYGPTHSQTLDKLLLTVDNLKVVALNSFVDPGQIYRSVLDNEKQPVIVIENKLDYARPVAARPPIPFKSEQAVVNGYPIVRIRPVLSPPTATIVTYGGASHAVMDCIVPLFIEHDVKAEVLILSKLKPIDCDVIVRSAETTGNLYVVEEGSRHHGIGSEIIAAVSERTEQKIVVQRIASLPCPIPSNKNLEADILVNRTRIIETIGRKSQAAWRQRIPG
ncbi:dehydrogenase E1 component subunit alpha/beta [Cohnella massiliensis]|uniref:dehydrogenase E1 component subunit alpha/beta n=1 Tax=Cohnella massiliensis TaxID=1816691 RepID=UPI0009BC523A|nr:alpha-ketoacid dehydrogenase subunit alpha/beta [Cohnella massiliensis]